MRKIRYFFIAILFVLSSCVDGVILSDAPDAVTAKNAILVYMVADNSLNSYTSANISAMGTYMSVSPLENCRLFVYRDGYSSDDPQLFEITDNGYGGATFPTIISYEEQNSASADIIAQVVSDFTGYVQADNYKLVLWSHGTGWAAVSSTSSKAILQDGSDWLDISEFKTALPDDVFDCVLFDACLMGNIEVAYSLKDKCNYIIASPSEVPGNGMPYDLILDGLFSGDYSDAAEQYFDYYDDNSGSYYDGTGLVGVYDMSKIDALAEKFTALISTRIADIDNVTGVQEFSSYGYSKYELYDFNDFVQTLVDDTSETAEFTAALEDFVIFSKYINDDDTTGVGNALQNSNSLPNYDVTDFCGVSCYIPYTTSSLYDEYQSTDWYLATYGTIEQ